MSTVCPQVGQKSHRLHIVLNISHPVYTVYILYTFNLCVRFISWWPLGEYCHWCVSVSALLTTGDLQGTSSDYIWWVHPSFLGFVWFESGIHYSLMFTMTNNSRDSRSERKINKRQSKRRHCGIRLWRAYERIWMRGSEAGTCEAKHISEDSDWEAEVKDVTERQALLRSHHLKQICVQPQVEEEGCGV